MRTPTREVRLSMKVWDGPVRLFHWAIVLLIIASYVTVETGHMQWHLLSGYTMLTLLLFRIVWGFVGSDTARFAHFLHGPGAAFRHLAAIGRRDPDNEVGHNAAGGWMVVLLLLLLLVQVATGLCSNDQVVTEGPLAHVVGSAWSDRLSSWHAFNWNLILAAIALHVVAIVVYLLVKRHNLTRAMITGRKRLPGRLSPPRIASPILALLVLIIAAGIVWTLVNYA